MAKDTNDYAVFIYLGQGIKPSKNTESDIKQKLTMVSFHGGLALEDFPLNQSKGPRGHHYSIGSLHLSEAESIVEELNKGNEYCAKQQYCR